MRYSGNMLPAAAPPPEPRKDTGLYAAAGAFLLAHFGAVMAIILGVIAFMYLFSGFIYVITLGSVWLMKDEHMMTPGLTALIVSLVAAAAFVIICMVLAVKSRRWAQLILVVGLGMCALADLTAAGYFSLQLERWAIYLAILTAGECVLLWELELKQRFRR